MATAEELARQHCDTTATDVVNALLTGALVAEDLPPELVEALQAEGIEPDSDPDDVRGWSMSPEGPVPD